MATSHGIVMVGHDKASSVALELVSQKLREVLMLKGVDSGISMYCAHGVPPLGPKRIQHIANEAARATVVITGVSSSPVLATEEIQSARTARERILAARAKGQTPDVVYGVYLDTDMGNRYWFDDRVADEVGFVFAPNREEAELAAKRYLKARVFLTGNPVEEAAAFPTTTREEIRASFSLRDNQPLILCPGGKDTEVNKEFLTGVVDAVLHSPMTQYDGLVVFSPHPGDLSDPTEYVDILEDAQYHARMVHGTVFKCSNLIPGCDIVVHSASTIAKEAGRQRKPAVNYFTASAFKRNPDLREWPPVARGVEEMVYEDPTALGKAIVRLLTPTGFASMRARQEALYLKPAYQGEAVDKMVAVLYGMIRA